MNCKGSGRKQCAMARVAPARHGWKVLSVQTQWYRLPCRSSGCSTSSRTGAPLSLDTVVRVPQRLRTDCVPCPAAAGAPTTGAGCGRVARVLVSIHFYPDPRDCRVAPPPPRPVSGRTQMSHFPRYAPAENTGYANQSKLSQLSLFALRGPLQPHLQGLSVYV
jgi:hypothetical protein